MESVGGDERNESSTSECWESVSTACLQRGAPISSAISKEQPAPDNDLGTKLALQGTPLLEGPSLILPCPFLLFFYFCPPLKRRGCSFEGREPWRDSSAGVADVNGQHRGQRSFKAPTSAALYGPHLRNASKCVARQGLMCISKTKARSGEERGMSFNLLKIY